MTTTLIYAAGKTSGWSETVHDRAVLLGKYSLFGYISQIAILQALRRISWLHDHGTIVLLFSLLAGFALAVSAVELTDLAKRKSTMVGRAYQLVFA